MPGPGPGRPFPGLCERWSSSSAARLAARQCAVVGGADVGPGVEHQQTPPAGGRQKVSVGRWPSTGHPRAAKHQRKRADRSRSRAYLRPLSASTTLSAQIYAFRPMVFGAWEDILSRAGKSRSDAVWRYS